jgi:hypothetical protein
MEAAGGEPSDKYVPGEAAHRSEAAAGPLRIGAATIEVCPNPPLLPVDPRTSRRVRLRRSERGARRHHRLGSRSRELASATLPLGHGSSPPPPPCLWVLGAEREAEGKCEVRD